MKDSVIFKLVETCITAEFCNILCMYIYIYQLFSLYTIGICFHGNRPSR